MPAPGPHSTEGPRGQGKRRASRCPGQSGGALRLPRAGWAGLHPAPLALGQGKRVSRLSPGRDRRSGVGARCGGEELSALGRGNRGEELAAAGAGGRSRAAGGGGWARVMSALQIILLKEECGNGEKFERVVCWSFDQLSVTFGRRETWVCVFSCARWLGVSLARKTALHSNPHGKS